MPLIFTDTQFETRYIFKYLCYFVRRMWSDYFMAIYHWENWEYWVILLLSQHQLMKYLTSHIKYNYITKKCYNATSSYIRKTNKALGFAIVIGLCQAKPNTINPNPLNYRNVVFSFCKRLCSFLATEEIWNRYTLPVVGHQKSTQGYSGWGKYRIAGVIFCDKFNQRLMSQTQALSKSK